MVHADRIGNAAKPIMCHERHQAAVDRFDQPESLVDQRRVELHRARTSADFGVGILGATHPTDTDQRDLTLGKAVDSAQDIGGFLKQWRAA